MVVGYNKTDRWGTGVFQNTVVGVFRYPLPIPYTLYPVPCAPYTPATHTPIDHHIHLVC
jgi:hypothetical protein